MLEPEVVMDSFRTEAEVEGLYAPEDMPPLPLDATEEVCEPLRDMLWWQMSKICLDGLCAK